MLKDVRCISFCEHCMLPVVGAANGDDVNTDRVVGITKTHASCAATSGVCRSRRR